MASTRVRIAMVRVQDFKGWLGARFWVFWILLSSGTLLLRHLGHRGLTYWDESFHAIVARNLTKHPLKFTLYDQPWLAYNYTDWGGNHIWLHKPPVPMWQICISYYVLGINAFALRMPSAIIGTIAVWLTYRIAADVFDRRAGVIAAFLQGFNPFLFASIHGYRYSDHIDITLLFWVEVSCWLLLRAIRTGQVWKFDIGKVERTFSQGNLGKRSVYVRLSPSSRLDREVNFVKSRKAGRKKNESDSVRFLNGFTEFKPTMTVTKWENGETHLVTLDNEELDYWLEKYPLGDLYESGELENMA